jgi:hypothetical protein
MKQGSLFCFVLFATCRSPLRTFGIFRKLWMTRGAPTWFGAIVWKLLIIEPFSQGKLNKIESENSIRIWGCSGCCWKALGESDLGEFVSQFSELRCERY